MPIDSLTGQCLCGAVKFTAEQVEPHIHACHCSMCRRWSGGPALAVAAANVRFEGEGQLAEYESSDWAARGFCKTCGSSLYYRLKSPEMYVMMSGAFDDGTAFSLEGEIFIDEKPAAYDFVGDHPRQTGEEFRKSIGME